MSIRDFSWGKGGQCFGWHPTTLVVPKVEKIRGLNLPGTPKATWACREIPLLYFTCFGSTVTIFSKLEMLKTRQRYHLLWSGQNAVSPHVSILHFTCTVLYCTVLYCTALYCTVLYCTVLHCTLLYCIALYCTVLYCTVLNCTVLYCIVLYFCQRVSTQLQLTNISYIINNFLITRKS